eukprot:7896738-Alexandrium_andersonii.AAC.1
MPQQGGQGPPGAIFVVAVRSPGASHVHIGRFSSPVAPHLRRCGVLAARLAGSGWGGVGPGPCVGGRVPWSGDE